MKVANIKPTKGISRENFIFRGIMELTVWDAGGQERYLERYFSESQRELIFSEVTTAVFMVDSPSVLSLNTLRNDSILITAPIISENTGILGLGEFLD